MFFKSKKTTPQNIFDAVELQDLDYIASIAKEKNFDIDQHCTEDKGLLATATALGLAAARGHYDVCVLLIELGADVNFEGLDGRLTPLDFAAENGHKNICELLLLKGAVKKHRTKDGHTPEQSALLRGHDKLAEFIKNYEKPQPGLCLII